MENTLLHSPHVGEILKYEFLQELDISENILAENLKLPYFSIQQIILGKSQMTADIDLRLCRYFGLSEGYFLRLQNSYELMEAKRSLGETLNQIIPYYSIPNVG
jgi:addiction module HigA family antidote